MRSKCRTPGCTEGAQAQGDFCELCQGINEFNEAVDAKLAIEKRKLPQKIKKEYFTIGYLTGLFVSGVILYILTLVKGYRP